MNLVVILSLAAVAAAAPPEVSPPNKAKVLSYESDIDATGKFKYGFSQTDGQKQEAQGELRNPGLENQFIAVKGSYQWLAPDGVLYIVRYVADQGGYQPTVEKYDNFDSDLSNRVGDYSAAVLQGLLGG